MGIFDTIFEDIKRNPFPLEDFMKDLGISSDVSPSEFCVRIVMPLVARWEKKVKPISEDKEILKRLIPCMRIFHIPKDGEESLGKVLSCLCEEYPETSPDISQFFQNFNSAESLDYLCLILIEVYRKGLINRLSWERLYFDLIAEDKYFILHGWIIDSYGFTWSHIASALHRIYG